MLIKLILGLSLIIGSNFIGHQKKKTVWVRTQIAGNPDIIQFEEKTVYERKRTTGETILALTMVSSGGVLFIWYLSDKEKKGLKNEKIKESRQVRIESSNKRRN